MTRKRKLKKSKGLHWKYRLRLLVVPILARLGRLLGVSWRTLGFWLGRETLVAQTRTQWPTKTVKPTDQPLDVVFLTIMAGDSPSTSAEVVLGRILQARGHRVRYVVCDQMLQVCDAKLAGNEQSWERTCAKCYAFGRTYLEGAGYEILPVSHLIADKADEGEWPYCVESALLKHYRVGVLPDDPAVEDCRKPFVEAARVSARLGKAVVRMRPDRVIMPFGIYCTWGPARKVLLDAGVPIVIHGPGKIRGTMMFNWSATADSWDVSREWEKAKDVSLAPQEAATVEDYLRSRRDHSRDIRVYNFGEEESLPETWKRLRLDAEKQTFVLFTNVLWDATSAQREIAFKNPIDWVMETIAWFAEHPDKQLVVKIHPAEVVIGTKQPFASLIKARFPELPHNVRVVEPHEKVNSWSIMQVADLGLVHTSTVGLELPLEGIPVAVVSETHYRGKGFTIDVTTRDEYFNLIENWDGGDVDPERLRVLSKRYAHLVFNRYLLPFPFLYRPVASDPRALEHLDEETLLAHPSVRVWVTAFETGEDFLLPG